MFDLIIFLRPILEHISGKTSPLDFLAQASLAIGAEDHMESPALSKWVTTGTKLIPFYTNYSHEIANRNRSVHIQPSSDPLEPFANGSRMSSRKDTRSDRFFMILVPFLLLIIEFIMIISHILLSFSKRRKREDNSGPRPIWDESPPP